MGGLVKDVKRVVHDIKTVIMRPRQPFATSPLTDTEPTHASIVQDLTKFVLGKLCRPW